MQLSSLIDSACDIGRYYSKIIPIAFTLDDLFRQPPGPKPKVAAGHLESPMILLRGWVFCTAPMSLDAAT